MISQGLYDHDTMRFFIDHKHYQQRAMAPTIDRQTMRCDPERALGGHFISEKTI